MWAALIITLAVTKCKCLNLDLTVDHYAIAWKFIDTIPFNLNLKPEVQSVFHNFNGTYDYASQTTTDNGTVEWSGWGAKLGPLFVGTKDVTVEKMGKIGLQIYLVNQSVLNVTLNTSLEGLRVLMNKKTFNSSSRMWFQVRMPLTIKLEIGYRRKQCYIDISEVIFSQLEWVELGINNYFPEGGSRSIWFSNSDGLINVTDSVRRGYLVSTHTRMNKILSNVIKESFDRSLHHAINSSNFLCHLF